MQNIESNWKTYEKLLRKLPEAGVDKLLSTLENRIVICPASPKLDMYSAYPGGLVKHCLDVTATMRRLNEALGYGIDTLSVIKVGLLHDLGKVGDLNSDYFIEQDSDWHREKLGQVYKYNENLNKMSVSHRSLFLLQSFSIGLSSDEWLAIQLSQGSHFEENRFYVGNEPTLALLIQQAKSTVIHKERNN